jgi:hypothetical protein
MRATILFDNPLFIRYWRERMRLHYVGAFGLITAIIILLIFLSAYLTPPKIYVYGPEPTINYDSGGKSSQCPISPPRKSNAYPVPWLHSVFFSLAVFQGILLLLVGTTSAYRMSFQERTSGTLDFHRSTPFWRFPQIMGIIFGSTVLEWIIFLWTLPISLFIVLLTPISIWTFLIFYVALAVCAIFYHSLAVCLGIASNQKRRELGILGIFFFAYFILALSFWLSCFYHAGCFPAYDYLYKNSFSLGVSLSERHYHYDYSFLTRDMFFGVKIPFLLFQLIIQLPLIALIWAGISRKIAYAERFLLSKTLSLALAFLVLYCSAASLISNQLIEKHSGDFNLIAFIYFIFTLMFIGANSATPTHLMYSKGLQRIKKLSLNRLSYWDDQGSNWVWLISCCLLALSMLGFFLNFVEISLRNKIIIMVFILSQIVSFASALEFFRLSRYHQKQILFWTGLGIVWIIIPILGMITEAAVMGFKGGDYLVYFFSASPFFGVTFFFENFFSKPEGKYLSDQQVFLAINILLAALMAYLAFRQRRRVKTEILTSK